MNTLAKLNRRDHSKGSDSDSFEESNEPKNEPKSDKDSLINDFFYDDQETKADEQRKVRSKKRTVVKTHKTMFDAMFATSKKYVIIFLATTPIAVLMLIIGLPLILQQVLADFAILYKMIAGLAVFFALLMAASHSVRKIGENIQDEFESVSGIRRLGGVLFIIFFILFLAVVFAAIVGAMFLYIVSNGNF